ncbi:DUF4192 domain-containing protein [Nakamurella sp. PAMC28650]|uniref:DUF4192 domain-containing protein n=1 Tax=Nakamurella sp. PAMC28650 TaxID=2762325 RepID=UPI00164E66B2|nr:DUF4192 domain-containing protein [Nakamurella sp. PAMC28650]QNK80137.1 DUF4192 domain-containing protein [Nakamurella sp. PAMC28650]
MTTTDETTTVRLTGRSGLLAAVPALLGFHPKESLVMVCLSGPRRRVGPVIRIDLDDLDEPGTRPGEIAGPIAQLQLHAARYADEIAVMCYTERPGRPAELDAVMRALVESGVGILDTVRITDGRANSWLPAHLGQLSDGPGSPMPDAADPQVEEITAATALNGRGILADRQALRDSIAGPTGAAAAQASASLHAAADGLLGRIGSTGPIEVDRLRAMAEVTIDGGLRQVAATGTVDPPTAALITLLLCDIGIRDGVIARAVTRIDESFVPMLIAVARTTPDDDAAEVCAVLSMAAYRRGDGALAQVAVDRTLMSEPNHRLAHLMLAMMASGIPPADLEHLATAVNPGTVG